MYSHPNTNIPFWIGKGKDRRVNHWKKNVYANGVVLTESQVLEIRRKYIPYVCTQATLATEYNVSKSNISAIITNKTWSHI